MTDELIAEYKAMVVKYWEEVKKYNILIRKYAINPRPVRPDIEKYKDSEGSTKSSEWKEVKDKYDKELDVWATEERKQTRFQDNEKFLKDMKVDISNKENEIKSSNLDYVFPFLELDYLFHIAIKNHHSEDRLIWMRSDSFLYLAKPMKGAKFLKLPPDEKAKELEDDIRSIKFAMNREMDDHVFVTELWFDGEKDEIMGHQGRHRNFANKLINGNTEMPVIIHPKGNKEFYSRRIGPSTKPEHQTYAKTRFIPYLNGKILSYLKEVINIEGLDQE